MDIQQSEQACIAETIKRFPVCWSRGEGSRLFDTTGREYIDFFGGHAVMALGYAHPEQQEAMHNQLSRLVHTGNLYHTGPPAELAAKLCHVSFAEKVFFANSGGEIVDLSFKLARRYWRNKRKKKKTGYQDNQNSKADPGPRIISMKDSFHGRAFGALTATGQKKYKTEMGPMLPGIQHIPFNDCRALDRAMDENTAAVLLETVQGDGGVIPATEEFLREARQLCNFHDALLIYDEIQTGLGRCGQTFAYELYDIVPDVMLLGKALGGGLPISALLSGKRVAESLGHGDHGSTFGGNPVAAAAGTVLLNCIQQPDFLNKIRKKAALLLEHFQQLQKDSSGLIQSIRGKGLLIGLELEKGAREITDLALKTGLIINNPKGEVLRIIPALNIPDNDLEEGCRRLETAIHKYYDYFM